MPPLQALADDVLCSILTRVSSAGGFSHALVCRQWAALAPHVQTQVSVRQRGLLDPRVLLDELCPFHNLTSLHLGCWSLSQMGDNFLSGLSRSHPHLRSLLLRQANSGAVCVTSAGLRSFLEDARSLRELRLPQDQKWTLDDDVLDFPPVGLLAFLEYLECSVLTVPEGIGTMQRLKTLRLHSVRAEFLPDSLCSLAALAHLSLDCDSLQALPPSLGDVTSLVTLSLCCGAATSLPPRIFALPRLRCLSVDCHVAKITLPEPPAPILPQLQVLSVSECQRLSCLPGRLLQSMGALTRLEAGNALGGMDGGFASLPSLKSLTIRSLESEAIACSVAPLEQLTRLQLAACEDLSELPQGLEALTSLVMLQLTNCNGVTVLPAACLSGLVSLETLCIACCQSLKSIPESISSLTSLTRLEVKSCYEITDLPGCLGLVTSLRVLVLDDLVLSTLPASLSYLDLDLFLVADCPNLECST